MLKELYSSGEQNAIFFVHITTPYIHPRPDFDWPMQFRLVYNMTVLGFVLFFENINIKCL